MLAKTNYSLERKDLLSYLFRSTASLSVCDVVTLVDNSENKSEDFTKDTSSDLGLNAIDIIVDFTSQKMKVRIMSNSALRYEWMRLNPNRPIAHFRELLSSRKFQRTKNKILNFVKKNPGILTSQIIDSHNIEISLILEVLNMLEAEGLLV